MKDNRVFNAAFLLLLTGCSLTSYEDGRTQPSATLKGATLGVAGGAVAGAALNSNIAVTAVTGGVLGGVMGASLKEAWGARENMKRAGVQVIQEGEELTLYIPADLCFDPNDDKLLESCYPVLDQVVVLMKTYSPCVPMCVVGHTDDVGSPHSKVTLSDHRARAIAAYLWAHGISQQQLKIVSASDNDPIASNRNSRGSAYNRRVQINIRPNLMP